MLMNDITCPHCGKKINIDEVVRHDLEKTILKDAAEKQKDALEQAKAEAENKFNKQLKEEKLRVIEKAEKEKKLLEEQLAKQEKENKLREEKAKEEGLKEASEKYRLERLAWEKTKSDMEKQIEGVKRTANQGSQQLQGEILELDLEGKLKSTFIYDEFLPVPKGVRGGDVIQNVRNKFGKVAAIIIWEFKRTKTWDKNWLAKLREDARTINANESIIVSDILPGEIQFYGKIDGVWVTNILYAIPLITILREMGIRIAVAKSGVQHDDESLMKIHEYILSEKFRHKIEKDVETTAKALSDLEKKHNVDDKYYRLQKSSLEALQANTTQIYFDLQEIIPALPSISGLEGELLDEEDTDEQNTLV